MNSVRLTGPDGIRLVLWPLGFADVAVAEITARSDTMMTPTDESSLGRGTGESLSSLAEQEAAGTPIEDAREKLGTLIPRDRTATLHLTSGAVK